MDRSRRALVLALLGPLVLIACGDDAIAATATDTDSATDSDGELLSHAGMPCNSDEDGSKACSDGAQSGIEVCLFDQDSGGDDQWSSCFVEACAEQGAVRECDGGVERCVKLAGELVWGVCAFDDCSAGETRVCGEGTEDETTVSCIISATGVSSITCPYNTPLLLAFDGREPELSAPLAAAAFDVGGRGACLDPHWPTAATPWLVRDIDRSGAIEGGHELFGSGTRLAAGGQAAHGFAALAELDEDGDGAITPADPLFDALLVWSDDDGDRRASGWELLPLAAYGVDALPLDYHVDVRCDALGNCGRERVSFTVGGPEGPRRAELIDVYLACE